MFISSDQKTIVCTSSPLNQCSRWQSNSTIFNGSLFNQVALQYGLACLKTPHCYRQPQFLLSGLPGIMQELRPRVGPERNPECPVCHPVLNSLAVSLPYAHCSQVLFHIFQVSNKLTTTFSQQCVFFKVPPDLLDIGKSSGRKQPANDAPKW